MLFNSIDFAVFLPVVFVLYWFVFRRSLWWQNLFVVAASYICYGWWDWRFLSLILFSTVVDFAVSTRMEGASTGGRKALLWVSLIVNLGLLGFFKYYNFFVESFRSAFTFLGAEVSTQTLDIILPIGISFYTFQTLSYTIDVYRRELTPTRDFVAFAAFVSFFPQLVAGPIERATNLLPQFLRARRFDYAGAVDGCRQILWGLVKKVVIADNCAEYANYAFNNSAELDGSTLLLGALFFTFQIYGDFSGYSDIAIGTARLFGFDLMRNFAYPYFSRDIAEFWRRWHISLSTWFKDYLYIPLGGSRGTLARQIRNVFIIFLVSGFWHGANWTFLIWGGLNAFYFLPLLLRNTNRKNLGLVGVESSVSLRDVVGILVTFSLTVLAWVFFRAESVSHALAYLSGIFSSSLFARPVFPDSLGALGTLGLVTVFMVCEWIGRRGQYALERIDLHTAKPIRFATYYLLMGLVAYFFGGEQEFIYFQF